MALHRYTQYTFNCIKYSEAKVFRVCQKQPILAIESHATDVHSLSFIKYYMILAEAMEGKLSTFISSTCACVCVCVGGCVFSRDTHHKT